MIGGTCASEVAPIAYLNRLLRGPHGGAVVRRPRRSQHARVVAERSLSRNATARPARERGRRKSSARWTFLSPRSRCSWSARATSTHPRLRWSQRARSTSRLHEYWATETICSAPSALASFSGFYVHLDLDVLDPASFPDVLMPTRDGCRPSAIAALVRRLATRFDVVGFSIVEFCDRTGRGIDALRALLEASGIRIGCCGATSAG